jgi:tRNA(Ile)-lysidine synthase
MPTQKSTPVTAAEAKALFSGLARAPVLLLAISGGPDSTALMVLAARWRQSLKAKPKLVAVTIDHGLRPESRSEAALVQRLARRLGIAHHTIAWRGPKPKSGLQQAARRARYRLLAETARAAGANHVLTAHTLDDQAETVLIRMSHGSGLSGLAAMSRIAMLPVVGAEGMKLVRPLLDIPKARLVATLRAAKIPFAEDPSNSDSRFTRARFRELMPSLAREGLDTRRLALLKRADLAIEAAVDRAEAELAVSRSGPVACGFAAGKFAQLPAEVALRLLGRAVAEAGDEGPVELAKLEALAAALAAAQQERATRFRRSLAGALVTLERERIVVERAPARRLKTLNQGRTRPGKNRKSALEY